MKKRVACRKGITVDKKTDLNVPHPTYELSNAQPSAMCRNAFDGLICWYTELLSKVLLDRPLASAAYTKRNIVSSVFFIVVIRSERVFEDL